MKKLNLSLVAIIISVLVFSACSDPHIVGKWEIKSVELKNIDEIFEKYSEMLKEEGNENMGEEELSELKTEAQQELKEELENSIIEFTSSKKFIVDGTEQGKWESRENNKIIISSDTDNPIECNIKEKSGRKVNLEMIIPYENDITLVFDLKLEKIKNK